MVRGETTFKSMYFFNKYYLAECLVVALAMCVLPPRQCIILGRHRVHPFGHTAHMRFPAKQKEFPKGIFWSKMDDGYKTDEDKEMPLTDDPAAHNGADEFPDTFTYYKNSYGAHMGDIFKDSYNFGTKNFAHIEEPYIEVYHKSNKVKKKKDKNRRKSKVEKDYPEMSAGDFQRVRKTLKQDELMVSDNFLCTVPHDWSPYVQKQFLLICCFHLCRAM